jgi:predicted Holliday junction resolvase-like endonuclease
MPQATPILAAAVVLLLFLCLSLKHRADKLLDELEEERHRTQSLMSTHGRINEQWFPLMDGFPYDSRNFKFLGQPIDGVQFEDDRIIFCEFKTNSSPLSTDQRRIRQMIEDGRVEWEEFRFKVD